MCQREGDYLVGRSQGDTETKAVVSSSETGGTESLKRGGDKEFSSRGKKMENTLANYFCCLRNAEFGQNMRKGSGGG